MPKKYHIEAKAAPPRHTPIGKHGIVDFNEDCAGACHHSVKKDCIYDIYKNEGVFRREMQGELHYLYNCMNCLRCVQNCTRAVVTRVVNPEYRWLGDAYWKPDMLLTAFTLWIDPLLPAWFRRRLGMPDQPGRRKLYLSRAGTDSRRVANEVALVERLAARGFEIVHPETLSVREQVELFAEAGHIVPPTARR